MNTQYFHARNDYIYQQQMTIALDLPDKETFVLYLDYNSPKILNLKMGISFCHPDDNYNKKIGREVADSNKVNTVFEIRNINYTDDAVFVSIEPINNKYFKRLKLRISDKSSKIYFISAR